MQNSPYKNVLSFQNEDSPICLFSLLGQEDHLELEIGFGRGQFIRERASICPEKKIMGIETKWKLVYLCQEKAKSCGLDNLLVLQGDARKIIIRIQQSECFDNVFINFPDPWWKSRHQKRKVITSEFLDDIIRLLKPGGKCFVQTDVDFRAHEYLEVLSSKDQLHPVEKGGLACNNPFEARSSREKRAMSLDIPVFRLLFAKKED